MHLVSVFILEFLGCNCFRCCTHLPRYSKLLNWNCPEVESIHLTFTECDNGSSNDWLNACQCLCQCLRTNNTIDTSWHHASALYSIWSYANDEQFKPLSTEQHYQLINARQCVGASAHIGCQPKIKAEWIYGLNPSNELFNEFIDNLNFFWNWHHLAINTLWKLSTLSHLLVHSEGTDPWKALTDLIEADVFLSLNLISFNEKRKKTRVNVSNSTVFLTRTPIIMRVREKKVSDLISML